TPLGPQLGAGGNAGGRASLARGYHVLVCGCHAPDGVPDVISDQEGAGFVDGHPDRPAARFAVRIEESRDDIFCLAVRTPAAESYEDDLVAVEPVAVPAAMLTDEGTAAIFLGKAVRRVEGEPQRGDMGAQRVIGNDRLLDQIRTLRLDARVEMLAPIAVRPAVEAAVLHRGHVIGHEIGAELVPFVDDGPQRAAFRLEGQAVGIAQATREDLPAAGCPLDLPDGGAVHLRPHAVFGDVAVGADADVKERAAWACHQALGPVVVDGAAGKRRQYGAGRGDLRIARRVGIANDRIGIGDIEVVADQGHTEGRVEVIEEDALRLRLAVAVSVAQQRYAVARPGVPARSDPGLNPAHDQILRAVDGIGPGLPRLDHQDVAVGENVDRARMLEAGRQRLNLQTVRDGRLFALLPADDPRKMHRREQILLKRGQVRVWPDLTCDIERRLLAAGRKGE